MRLLLAVGHTEIQQFIARDIRVEISEIADTEEELYEMTNYSKADTLILSRYLKGSQNHRLLIERIKATRPDLRIIYLYGEADHEVESFIQFLERTNITDYKVGANISSYDISRLLFRKDEKSVGIKGFFHKQPKTIWLKELDRAVVTVYSYASNGKSHLTWNLSTAFAKRGYKTTLINLDRGYSANIYFGLNDVYYDLLNYLIAQEDYIRLLDSCYKQGNLSVITGALGDKAQVSKEALQKMLYFVRGNSDIVIIDTHTGLVDTTMQAINSSDMDILVFDCDLMHFHMNKLMLSELENNFLGNKTYAVINNYSPGSDSYQYIYRQIQKMDIQFKGILPLSSCGSLGCNLMSTGRTPYEEAGGSGFFMDINNIMHAMNARDVAITSNFFNKGVVR